MKRIPLLLLSICCAIGVSQAQSLNSFGLSNESGIYSVFANPASGASSLNRFSINLSSASFGLENNFLRSQLNYSVLDLITLKQYREGGSLIQSPYFKLNNSEVENPRFFAEAEMVGPSLVVGLTKNISLHGYLKERFIGNFDKSNWATVQFLDEKQFRNASTEGAYMADLRSTAFREIGFGASLVLFEKRQSQLKAGLTYKRIQARYLNVLDVPYFDVSSTDEGSSVHARISEFTSTSSLENQNFLSLKNDGMIGKGSGFDFGLVYEFRPYSMKSTYRKYQLKGWNTNFKRHNHLKYKYRISLAILDLGKIKYDAALIEQNEYIIDETYNSGSFSEHTTVDYLNSVQDSSGAVQIDEALVLTLPKRMNFGFDYHIYKGMYASFTANYSLQNANRGNLEYSNSLGLQIRNEGRKVMWMVPLRVVPETNTYTLGGMVKVGPFFIGSNNVRTLFSKNLSDLSLYTGFLFNIPYKKDPTIENFRHIKFLKKQKNVLY